MIYNIKCCILFILFFIMIYGAGYVAGHQDASFHEHVTGGIFGGAVR